MQISEDGLLKGRITSLPQQELGTLVCAGGRTRTTLRPTAQTTTQGSQRQQQLLTARSFLKRSSHEWAEWKQLSEVWLSSIWVPQWHIIMPSLSHKWPRPFTRSPLQCGVTGFCWQRGWQCSSIGIKERGDTTAPTTGDVCLCIVALILLMLVTHWSKFALWNDSENGES